MPTGKTIWEIAKSQIGVKEDPPNSNNVKYNTWYYGREVYDGLWGTTFPWCMAFVQWVYDRANCKLPYITADCDYLLDWYRRNQPECVISAPAAEQGDIIIYGFGHCGIVESIIGNTLLAIEGNTAIGNDSNGGEVMRRARLLTQVRAFIRPHGIEKEQESDEMDIAKLTEKECYEILTKANEYAKTQPLPEWAKAEIEIAQANGITDGTNPMVLIPRYQAAIMANRAYEKAYKDIIAHFSQDK